MSAHSLLSPHFTIYYLYFPPFYLPSKFSPYPMREIEGDSKSPVACLYHSDLFFPPPIIIDLASFSFSQILSIQIWWPNHAKKYMTNSEWYITNNNRTQKTSWDFLWLAANTSDHSQCMVTATHKDSSSTTYSQTTIKWTFAAYEVFASQRYYFVHGFHWPEYSLFPVNPPFPRLTWHVNRCRLPPVIRLTWPAASHLSEQHSHCLLGSHRYLSAIHWSPLFHLMTFPKSILFCFFILIVSCCEQHCDIITVWSAADKGYAPKNCLGTNVNSAPMHISLVRTVRFTSCDVEPKN